MRVGCLQDVMFNILTKALHIGCVAIAKTLSSAAVPNFC
jgi:hypothetical protein